MEENNSRATDWPQTIADTLQQLSSISLDSVRPLIDSAVENANKFNKSIASGTIPQFSLRDLYGGYQNKNCATPENECPPHCIATIRRNAMAGEQIIVPFVVKNTCSVSKTWRVGVRELEDINGEAAPSQPRLNKDAVTLAPGRSEQVLMALDLSKFRNGSRYTCEIVLREKEINQNICFHLNVGDHTATVVTPQDEQKYKLKWQSWQSHFYCEPEADGRRP